MKKETIQKILKLDGKNRIGLIDEVRGFAILCMVFYHMLYDLVFIFNVDIPFFYSGLMSFLQNSFAALFIFISGASSCFSKNNLKRGAICFGLGMGMTAITAFFMPDEIVVFGILHMLGACMMIYALVARWLNKIPIKTGMILFLVLFVLTYGVYQGYVGIPNLIEIELPWEFYQNNWLIPFGFIPTGFFSSDYFPLFPWIFMFFAGSYFGKLLLQRKMPAFFYQTHSKLLALVGRNTLLIYLVHQPILLVILYLISLFFEMG